MVELEELTKNQKVFADAMALLARENQELKDRIAQSIGAARQHDEVISKAPEPNRDRRIIGTHANNPEPLDRSPYRGSRLSDPYFIPEDSDYFDSKNRRAERPAGEEDHQRAMEDLRAEMMAEIKQLKARQGGGRLEEVMREASTTPLTPHLGKALIPQKCPIPAFECYDGSSDPAAILDRKEIEKAIRGLLRTVQNRRGQVDDHEECTNAPITFDIEDIEDDIEDHNDPLVLKLSIAGCNIRKVLIVEGSSVNVLFYDTFKRIEMNDEQLMSSYYTIYGFNGAPTKPLGDIVLQVNAGPMKVDTRFSVVGSHSPYNSFIGRRWVHKLKGVPTTYHQYLRFPTPEGVMEIKGDHVTAQECQTIQNHLNNEQDEQRKSRRNRNKEAAKEKAIDLYLEEISGKSLTKESIVLNTEASTSISNGVGEPTK
ncbi:uncharacterized protein LOC113290801 [Papaver somniferum]|uniref:uncharacterized protein LOC113290801 n=1 Tax=Papaver somniferum TaxID=3469 RepID=UPI000E6FD164|nr:uncharacterized protein LOC113290801 [Papaver somniferum]